MTSATPGGRAIELESLMQRTRGSRKIRIAIIDGPVALHLAAFSTTNVEIVGNNECAQRQACDHGTHIASILAARDPRIRSICPDCTFLIGPIFHDSTAENSEITTTHIAAMLIECVNADAHIVNLSLSISGLNTRRFEPLWEAITYAASKSVLVIAAAGNDAQVRSSQLIQHPWVIAVAASDVTGSPLSISNLSSLMRTRGILAPGEMIAGIGADDQLVAITGTSAAVALVTGTAALLRSLFPSASSEEVRNALLYSNSSRGNLAPPLLNATKAIDYLYDFHAPTTKRLPMDVISQSAEPEADSAAMSGRATPRVQTAECSGAKPSVQTPTFVYAIGQIRPRFPSLSIEKEFAQVTTISDAGPATDARVLFETLSKRPNRYLLRQLCWTLSIEGLETYFLHPRDPLELELLVEALRPRPSPSDIDVIVGIKGPLVPADYCAGLQLPIVAFDRIYSFDIEGLISALPLPKDAIESNFRESAGELLSHVMQLADNAGSSDEHRAINYLAVRYPAIYATVSAAHQRNESLNHVEVRTSRLTGLRKIVDVIFSFTHRSTDVTDKWFVRVDVTEEFPFLVTKMSRYYDR